jgi:hypothetical protein
MGWKWNSREAGGGGGRPRRGGPAGGRGPGPDKLGHITMIMMERGRESRYALISEVCFDQRGKDET